MDRPSQHRASEPAAEVNFAQVLRGHGVEALRRAVTTTLQVNVGKRCNQACHHCHVDAGPARQESMTTATALRVIEVLDSSPTIDTVDITGGAPELNPNFRMLVEGARRLGRAVIVRCNLTVLLVRDMEWLPEFYRAHQVRLVCSLPCYSEENVTRQRGAGVFAKSIEALQLLNGLGYGTGAYPLAVVYNPVGPALPPPQATLEARYRDELGANFGIRFDRLLTITNMPINRFAAELARAGQHAAYLGLLVNHFNPATVAGLMCRSLISVGYDGRLYDCDFNQMLELALGASGGRPVTLWDVHHLSGFEGAAIATGSHCFGCTAGSGSSCGGALAVTGG